MRTIAVFLSTPSARRATRHEHTYQQGLENFYPRPPRGGRPNDIEMEQIRRNFYPRPPRGGRPARTTATSRQMRFLSTPSARRATTNRSLEVVTAQFLSTPSARRATSPRSFGGRIWIISIHALREEGDRRCAGGQRGGEISIHALREEGDSKNRDKISIFKQIIQHSARI